MTGYISLFLATITATVCCGKTITSTNETDSVLHANDSIRKKGSAANDYIGFYQKYISEIRGHSCPMYPSCSNYGLMTFNEKNFVSGFVMTSDRLLRCGHDHDNYELTLGVNGFQYIDYPAYAKPPREFYYRRNSYYFAYSNVVKDDSVLFFVKKLMNEQYHRQAMLEIMRIEHQMDSFNLELFINKVVCHKALGEYEKALFEYETRCPPKHKSDSELTFQIALIQYKLQNYTEAFQKTSLAMESCTDTVCRARVIMLNGLLYAHKYEWQNAMMAFQSLSAFESYKTVAIANSAILESAMQLTDKSPFLAGALSVVPGAGYAYAGHMQTALSAFVVNGLLAYATYTNVTNRNYGMAALTGVFNLSFYIGNIYGASKSAIRHNEKQKEAIIDRLGYNTNL